MKDLLNQDRALSPALVKGATGLLALLLLALGTLIVLAALGNLFNGRVLTAIVQLCGGAASIVFVFLVVRLLGEMLMALHRLNDRLTILGDDLRAARADVRSESQPASAKPAAKRKPAPPAPTEED